MAYGQKSLWIHGAHGGHGIFWELLRKKSLEEIFVKIWPEARNDLPLCLHKQNLQQKSLTIMRSSSGCCPGLGKPLGFQPVFACVSKSLEES